MAKYRTKQRDEILAYLKTTNSQHFTVADLCDHFRHHNIPVGTTTIYRQLEQLIDEGLVKKYIIDENSSACFEYIGDDTSSEPGCCYHLKCSVCGRLIHLTCSEISAFEDHIAKEHGFKIDKMRTVFYGTCSECSTKHPL